MSEGVLSQDEIDPLLDEIVQLLTAINVEDIKGKSAFESVKDFENYLLGRKYAPEEPYGIFDTDVTMCRFFETEENEKILSDISQKNEEQGMGNIKIPNTNITLINFSSCPKCKTVYSFTEVMDYYANPKPDARYKNRAWQARQDTRMGCKVCDTWFLPSLVISDGTPKNEVQFLCRTQTIDAIENYFFANKIRVLTKRSKNILERDGSRAVKNDVFLKDMEKKPTLISNMLQYTPINVMQNVIDGTNVEKGDLLFNQWG